MLTGAENERLSRAARRLGRFGQMTAKTSGNNRHSALLQKASAARPLVIASGQRHRLSSGL
jgi:hypothetical protein